MRRFIMLALPGILLYGAFAATPASAQNCTPHKGNELRCALQKRFTKPRTTASVVVQPTPGAGGGGMADFYASQCGFPGTQSGSVYIDAGIAQRIVIGGVSMINFEGVQQCFELFVTNCARGSQPARCSDIFLPGSLRLEVE